jgi:hypothetical protein
VEANAGCCVVVEENEGKGKGKYFVRGGVGVGLGVIRTLLFPSWKII